jgi:hypothetical protein
VGRGAWVPRNVASDFDWPIQEGFYTLSVDYDIVGESLDGAFHMAALRTPGLYSYDLNRDMQPSPVLGVEKKLSALRRGERAILISPRLIYHYNGRTLREYPI